MRRQDDRTDTLFQLSQTTLRDGERIRVYQGIEQRLVGEAVVVPIQRIRWIFGSRARVRGVRHHPIHGVHKPMDAWLA